MAISDDKVQLQNFFRNAYQWVEYSSIDGPYATDAGWPTVRTLRKVSENARDAWMEFSQTQPISRFIDAIESLNEAQLIANGLSGKQLLYKLNLLNIQAERALSGGRRANEKFVQLVSLLLQSLLDALKLGEAFKELVQALESQLK